MLHLLVAILAIASQATAQWGHHQYPGEPPYRPFPPYPWYPPKAPAPQGPHPNRQPVYPVVKSAQVLGLANDPALNRDSIGSVTFGDRTFWTSRDTQLFLSNGSVQVNPVITSTASWSGFSRFGGPLLQDLPAGADPLNSTILLQYGQNPTTQAFYPVTPDFCTAPGGSCPDGTRFALWPDLPPMISQSSGYGITAYTWIRQSHITPNLTTVIENPASLLYRVNYNPREGYQDPLALPQVTIVDENFWQVDEIPFGNYGNVVKDGIAYLYGQANGSTALAKVSVNEVENKSAYQYWVNGIWTEQSPALGQDGINITNANAGGQGTYYYSEPWQSYVWVGGEQAIGANMFITTAPEPTGPWIEPQLFFTGPSGNYFLGAYSIQAHPGLSTDPQSNEIYVTYTKNDLNGDGVNVYTSPLVYVQWE